MHADDVFRARLNEVITELEQWGHAQRDVATIESAAAAAFWEMAVTPNLKGACPFGVLFRPDQRFTLALGDEIYEDKPFDRFDFFIMLARAVAAGKIDMLETRSALTGTLEKIETRVELEDGWAWIGERRIGGRAVRKTDAAQEVRTRRFLPYRR